MEKIIAYIVVSVLYVTWFWIVPLFLWKKTTPAWFRVSVLHFSAVVGVGLGMLFSWIVKVLLS